MSKHKLISGCLVLALIGLALNTRAYRQGDAGRRLRVLFVDSKNHSLDDVQEQDIEVLENGVRQQASLKKEALPARYALVVDTSGSLRTQFPNVLSAARAILNLGADSDETALIHFVTSSNIGVVQSFTSERPRLLSAIETLKIEAGHTALVDAIYASAKYVSERARLDKAQQRNNALVVITDGENRESQHQPEGLSSFIRTQNVRIYTIGLISELDDEAPLIRKSPRRRAEELLKNLAKDTGGRTYLVNDKQSFQEAISEIVHDLHNDYLVTYNSTSVKPNPDIEINVTKSADKKNRNAIFNPHVAP